MASRAYQPEQTQAPYRGLGRQSTFGDLQIDALLLYDNLRLKDPLGLNFGEPEHFEITIWPEREAFKAHYTQWLEDSLFDSLPDAMCAHESFNAIVAQGDRVVPLIAAELRRAPSFIFLALEDITGEDPVPEEAQGDLNATIAAWLSWLRK